MTTRPDPGPGSGKAKGAWKWRAREIASARKKTIGTQSRTRFSGEGHDPDAAFCGFCAAKL